MTFGLYAWLRKSRVCHTPPRARQNRPIRLSISRSARDQRREGEDIRGWRPTKVHWIGLCILLLALSTSLFQAGRLHPSQQALLLFTSRPAESYALPTPTPTPSQPPAPPPHRPTPPPPVGSGQVISIIQSVFGSYANEAIAVARCESGLNPSAVNPTSINGSHASGLFQILYPSTWRTTSQAGASPYNAQANAQAAYEIFRRDGYNWHEWSCQPG